MLLKLISSKASMCDNSCTYSAGILDILSIKKNLFVQISGSVWWSIFFYPSSCKFYLVIRLANVKPSNGAFPRRRFFLYRKWKALTISRAAIKRKKALCVNFSEILRQFFFFFFWGGGGGGGGGYKIKLTAAPSLLNDENIIY